MYYKHKDIHKFEFQGAVVAIVGVLFMFLDPSARKVGHLSGNMGVDFALLFSNVPAALYFALNKSLMRDRLIPHLALMNLITCFGFIFLSVLVENSTFSTNPEHGIFGWLRTELQFKTIIYYGFFGTFWGSSVGYLIIMKFYSPLICMNTLLFEPIIA